MPKKSELIAICAILMSSVALSIDIMLPSLGDISRMLGVQGGNDRQLVIVALFVGLTCGQLVFGPVSDKTGRRPMIFLGIGVFVVGSMICALAASFEEMLSGRILQGFGAAGPRIVTVALIRDRFEGQDMAQVMSIIMGIFIFVPILAPSVGQALLFLMPWRGLFLVLAVISLAGGTWLALRQQETVTKPVALTARTYARASLEVFRSSTPMAFTFAGACAYGALMGYINSSQQLFQDVYGLGDAYALWFGLSAAFISAATFINARLVASIRMEIICLAAMAIFVLWVLGFELYFRSTDHSPDLWLWMIFNCVALFLLGLTFGNFNAIALKPFRHIAGIASALVASVNSALSISIAWLIGNAFDGNVTAITLGYLCCGAAAVVAILVFDQKRSLRSQRHPLA